MALSALQTQVTLAWFQNSLLNHIRLPPWNKKQKDLSEGRASATLSRTESLAAVLQPAATSQTHVGPVLFTLYVLL